MNDKEAESLLNAHDARIRTRVAVVVGRRDGRNTYKLRIVHVNTWQLFIFSAAGLYSRGKFL